MKKNNTWLICVALIAGLSSLASCNKDDDNDDESVQLLGNQTLTLVATSQKQWTGVAVSNTSRVFANYPNWSPGHTISVVEVLENSETVPYPNQDWNTWDASMDPATHFICVQAVYVDNQNFLWVLDPANPQRNGEYLGVVKGGAKLVKIDPGTNSVVQTIIYDEPVIEKNSYLNDVRIDESKGFAYITDSNEGAIVVTNLNTGKSVRRLAGDPSTKDENEVINVEGIEWRNPDGTLPKVHSDGIALSPDKTFLYWRPLTGRSLYRVETNLLRDTSVAETALAAEVERLGTLAPSDGIIFGMDGNLYLTSIEENAVRRYESGDQASLVLMDDELKWPDSFSNGPDGSIYVTTSQIHLKNPAEPYKIFKFNVQ